mgnify:FL=1
MTFDPNKTISARVRRRIVKDWRSRLSDWSTIALGLSAGIVATWMTFPADFLAFLPVEWVAKGTGALSALGLVAKFIVQGPVKEKP